MREQSAGAGTSVWIVLATIAGVAVVWCCRFSEMEVSPADVKWPESSMSAVLAAPRTLEGQHRMARLGCAAPSDDTMLLQQTIAGAAFECSERGYPRSVYVRCRSVEPGAKARTAIYCLEDGMLCATGTPQVIADGWNRWELECCSELQAGATYLLVFQHNAAAAVAYGRASGIAVYGDAAGTEFGEDLPEKIHVTPLEEGRALSICCEYEPRVLRRASASG